MLEAEKLSTVVTTEILEPRSEIFGRDHHDTVHLSRIGKRPVLKRSFGLIALLGFSCTILITWEGILLSYGIVYEEGGPAGCVYSFLVGWLGTLWAYLCLAELASMAPTSGGQYHWVSMLAPKSCHKFLSYLAGWLTLAGWQASCASGAFNSGIVIQGLVKLCNPLYEPKGWVSALIAFAVLIFAVFINTVATTALAKFEISLLFVHVFGFFAILIPVVYMSPHVDAHDVFATYIDLGGWGSNGYSFFIGLVGVSYSFVGGDAAMHMAEEIRNAALVIPKALTLGVLLNGAFGFGILVAVLFCMGPPSEAGAIFGTKLGFPFILVIKNAIESIPGTAIMVSLIAVLGASAVVGGVAASSRMFWSFARDRGLPFSSHLSKVNKRTSIPTAAVITTSTISGSLCLIGIGSDLAFNIIVSITVVGLYASYMLPIGLLLWRRITGAIQIESALDSEASNTINSPDGQLTWGPFRLPGVMGIINNTMAMAYIVIVFIFAFWPPALPVNAQSMNYSCVVFGATILFGIGWYFAVGRKEYAGPIIETFVLEEEIKIVVDMNGYYIRSLSSAVFAILCKNNPTIIARLGACE